MTHSLTVARLLPWAGLLLACGTPPTSNSAPNARPDSRAAQAKPHPRLAQSVNCDTVHPSGTVITTPAFRGRCIHEVTGQAEEEDDDQSDRDVDYEGEDSDGELTPPERRPKPRKIYLGVNSWRKTQFLDTFKESAAKPRELARRLIRERRIEFMTRDWGKACLRSERAEGQRHILSYDALDVIYITPADMSFLAFDVIIDDQSGAVSVRHTFGPKQVCSWPDGEPPPPGRRPHAPR